MSISTQWIAMGVDAVYVSLYGNNGLLTGSVLELTPGTISHDVRWQAVKTVTSNIPALGNVGITGDNRSQGFFITDRTDTPSMAIQVANSQVALENSMQGLPTYSHNQFDTLLIDPEIPGIRKNIYMIIHAEAKANAYGEVETVGWEIIQILKGTISAGVPAGLEEVTGHAVDFTMFFDRQSTWPDGMAFSINNEGSRAASGNRNGSDYRYRRSALLGDGVATSTTLPEEVAADHTDTTIYAVEIVEYELATNTATVLTPTTDYTTTINTGAGTTTVTLEVGYGTFDLGKHYTINYRY
ncbi:MAG: hypothetical protein GTO60_16705 [Gammaproteobacteria bacterium]|nr:hypothetical protein [Gammaproteobacteria bacterium]